MQLLKKEEKKVNPREVAQKIIDSLPTCELIGKVCANCVTIIVFIILQLFTKHLLTVW